MRALWVMVATELRMQLRQPVALVLLVLAPALGTPLALLSGGWYLDSLEEVATAREAEGQGPWRVLVRGDASARGWLDDEALDVVDADEDDPVAVVGVDGTTVTVTFEHPDGEHAAAAVAEAVERHDDLVRAAALDAAGIPSVRREVEVVDRAVGDVAKGRAAAAILPLALFLSAMIAIYTALDVVSGERERKTAEALLTAPVDRTAIALAKGIVTAGSGAVTATIGVVSAGVLPLLGLTTTALPAETLTPPLLLAVAAAAAAVSVQLAAVAMVLAAWSPDYRTGSMLSAPVMLAVLAPAGAGAVPSVELSPLLALVPVANAAVACRDLLLGELRPSLAALALAATLVHTAAAVALAGRLLGRDEALVGVGDASGRQELGWFGREALALLVVTLLLLWFFGSLAQQAHPHLGMVFTQLGLVGLPALAAVAWLGLPWRATLSWSWPGPVDLLLAVGVGVCSPGLGWAIVSVQQLVMPFPEAMAEALAILDDAGQPLPLLLVVFALLPGVNEELLFRGTLLGMLRRSFPPVARVLLVAAAFSIVHLSVHRLAPTFVLGALLGWVALRTGSILPAMVVHAVNNAVVIVFAWSSTTDELPPVWVMGAGLVVAPLLVAAMGRSRPG